MPCRSDELASRFVLTIMPLNREGSSREENRVQSLCVPDFLTEQERNAMLNWTETEELLWFVQSSVRLLGC